MLRDIISERKNDVLAIYSKNFKSREEFIDFIEKRGGRLIGTGANADAYTDPKNPFFGGTKYVIRVTKENPSSHGESRDSGWVKWAEFCANNRHVSPNLPVVLQVKSFGDWHFAAMEHLNFDSKLYYDSFRVRDDDVPKEISYRLSDIAAHVGRQGVGKQWNNGFTDHNDEAALKEKFGQGFIIALGAAGKIAAKRGIGSAIGYLDVTPGNIGFRKDGTPVVSDPIRV